jgi:Leucine-rich repeat (LRR) protein
LVEFSFELPRPYAVDICEALRRRQLIRGVVASSGGERAFAADMSLYRFNVDTPVHNALHVATLAALASASGDVRLDASNAALTALPEQLYLPSLRKSLEHLSLRSNLLRALPASFAQWRALQTLDLCDNELETLPSAVGDLRSLRTLLLDGNELRHLPSALARCSALRVLSANNNPLLSTLHSALCSALTKLNT